MFGRELAHANGTTPKHRFLYKDSNSPLGGQGESEFEIKLRSQGQKIPKMTPKIQKSMLLCENKLDPP